MAKREFYGCRGMGNVTGMGLLWREISAEREEKKMHEWRFIEVEKLAFLLVN